MWPLVENWSVLEFVLAGMALALMIDVVLIPAWWLTMFLRRAMCPQR